MAPRPPSSGNQPIEVAVLTSPADDSPRFQALSGAYMIEGTLEMDAVAERFKLMRLTVTAVDSDAEVTTTALRSLNITKFVAQGKAAVARQARFIAFDHPQLVERLLGREQTSIPDELIARARARIKAASRPGRVQARGRDDAFYRRIALDLIELVESGRPTPDGVLETLAALESKRLKIEVPVQTLRTWIKVARDKDHQFLAPGERGRMAAYPGPRLYALDEES